MNGKWNITLVTKKKPRLKNPILIEGLPGIGNVGKVAVDYMIEELGATKLYDIFSHTFPHSVFVNENNLVELPMIEMYYKKLKNGQDLLLLAGDVQPTDEISCYEFSEKMIDVLKEFKGKELITLGGIGLQAAPKKPKVYCTGNTSAIIKKYKKSTSLNEQLYGVVGPIVGVSGLLVGLATRRKINGLAILAETLGHPMYLGMRGAKEILSVLNKKLELKLNLKKLDKEIENMESELAQRSQAADKTQKDLALKGVQKHSSRSYIG